MSPETRYARCGEIRLAYQVFGEGPLDLIIVPAWISHVEHIWALPTAAEFLERLAARARVLMFDKGGTGCSDAVAPTQLRSPDRRLVEIRAVADAAGFERMALLGISDGALTAGLFAARYPDLVSALVLYAGAARYSWSDDYPIGLKPEWLEPLLEFIGRNWGSGEGVALRAPGMAGDPGFREWFARSEQLGATAEIAMELLRLNQAADGRAALATIKAPTLIVHRSGDMVVSVEHGRYLNHLIDHSRLIELPGDDHLPWTGDLDMLLEPVLRFFASETSPAGGSESSPAAGEPATAVAENRRMP